MEVLVLCLFIAAVMPFIAKIPVATAMHKIGGYDNAHPRAQQSQLQGFGARALAAHQNAFESLIIFATAILCAIATQTTGEFIQQLAMVHVGSRIVYWILYLCNLSTLRSITWFVATSCSFVILYQCL